MRTPKSEKSVLTEKKPLNDEDIWTYLPHSSPLQFVWLLILSLTGFFNGAIAQTLIFLLYTPEFSFYYENEEYNSTQKFDSACQG